MMMYADRSTTGINMMDMTRRQARMIRDSLTSTILRCELEPEQRQEIVFMISQLDSVCNIESSQNKPEINF